MSYHSSMQFFHSAEELVASIIKDSKRKTDYQTEEGDGVTDVKKAKLTDEVNQEENSTTHDDKTMFNLVESAPRITVHTLDVVGSCTHEVAVPPGQDYVPLKPPTGEPAKTYKFTLDPFQVITWACFCDLL